MDQLRGCSFRSHSIRRTPRFSSRRCSWRSASSPRCRSRSAGASRARPRACPPAPAPASPRPCRRRRRTASRTARTPGRRARGAAATRLRAEQRAHAVDEEHAGQHQADLDRHGEVEDHGQREGADEDGAVRQREAGAAARTRATRPCSTPRTAGCRPAPPAARAAPAARPTSTITSSASACTMPATGLCRAGAHVGHGARDRAGGRDAAEERRHDVGDALRHQLLVRVVLGRVAQVVGDARAQQRFDGAEQRDRQRRDEQLLGARPS